MGNTESLDFDEKVPLYTAHKQKSRYNVIEEGVKLIIARRTEDHSICYLKQFHITSEDRNQVLFESVMIQNVAHPFILTALESWTTCDSKHYSVTREELGGDLATFLR